MADPYLTQDIIVARIENRRGRRVNLPQPLRPGELGWCMDTKQLFIGVSDEDAVAAVELFRGEPLGSQDLVNQTLLHNIFTFVSEPTTLTDAEKQNLAELAKFPQLYYVSDTNRESINEYERNIEIIRSVKTSVLQSTGSASDIRYTLMYSWTIDSSDQYTFKFFAGCQPPDSFNLTTIANNSYIIDNTVNSAYNNGIVMDAGILFTDTVHESASLSVLINEYITTDSDKAYVTTKQNVEILTEYFKTTSSTDVIVNSPITYELEPSNSFTLVKTIDIINGGNYETSPMTFDGSVSDTFNIDYSISFDDMQGPVMGNDGRFVQTGTLNIILSKGSETVVVSDTSVEHRSSVGYDADVDFSGEYVAPNTVNITYRHNFPSRVLLKLTTKRWISWDNESVQN